MNRALVLLSAVCAACAGGGGTRTAAAPPLPTPVRVDSTTRGGTDSLGAAVARQATDSVADQAALDSLHRPRPAGAAAPAAPPIPQPAAVSDTTTPVRGEEVVREAVKLFGPEGRQVVGAAAPAEPAFDIDVTSFATDRRVLQYLEFFQVDARDRFAIWLTRLGRYEGMLRERFRAHGLPEDLTYLTLVESGLSNTAVSRARAVGMWQFMAGTARLYGLTVDPWVDERRDPYRATEAAASLLSDLRQRLGSVYLAAAAYDAGAGRIERGIGRLGDVDTVTDQTFFQLADRRYLRRETRDYVPKLIAAALIAKQPDRYGFTDVAPMEPLVFDEVLVPDATGLDVLARLADTTVDAMLELNPQFVRGMTPPGRTVVVRVPRGRGTQVAARYQDLPVTDRITFVDHYVTRGQTLSEIAHRYQVPVAMIEGANPHVSSRALRVGQRIIIPMSGRVVPASAWSVPPEGGVRRLHSTGPGNSYRVERGETAIAIARHFGVTLSALLSYNGLSEESILRAGEVIRIPPK